MIWTLILVLLLLLLPPLLLLLVLLLLLLLLLVVETKTAAQHSCHMLQVRDFNGILLGIGSKVWRDVSSWTSCRCGTQVLVGLLLVFCCVVLGRGGSKKQQRGCSFVSRMW